MAIKVLHSVVLVVGLLMAEAVLCQDDPTLWSSVASHGRDGEAQTSRSFSVELEVRNMARGSVAFQLGSLLGSKNEVEVLTGQWAAMGPVKVRAEHPVVVLGVTVKASHALVKKVLRIDLVKYNFGDSAGLECGRKVVVTALEGWRLKSGKYLVIRIGTHNKSALSFKF